MTSQGLFDLLTYPLGCDIGRTRDTVLEERMYTCVPAVAAQLYQLILAEKYKWL
jgi:hypothetical protein